MFFGGNWSVLIFTPFATMTQCCVLCLASFISASPSRRYFMYLKKIEEIEKEKSYLWLLRGSDNFFLGVLKLSTSPHRSGLAPKTAKLSGSNFSPKLFLFPFFPERNVLHILSFSLLPPFPPPRPSLSRSLSEADYKGGSASSLATLATLAHASTYWQTYFTLCAT